MGDPDHALRSCGAGLCRPRRATSRGAGHQCQLPQGHSHGWVTGIARPVHIGRSTHVWAIELRNDVGELTCVSRTTMAVLQPA